MRLRLLATFVVMTLGTLGTVSVAGANHSGDRDCPDFQFQEDAQEHLEAHPGDPDNLDADNDDIACENLPSRGGDDDGGEDDGEEGTTTTTTKPDRPTTTVKKADEPLPKKATDDAAKKPAVKAADVPVAKAAKPQRVAPSFTG